MLSRQVGVAAVLVHPGFKDVGRVTAYVEKLAGKYPELIVASAGAGYAVVSMERAALSAGLRVAAFRCEPFPPPTVGAPRRLKDDEEAFPKTRETRYRIVLHELRPEAEGVIDRLSVSESKMLDGEIEGYAAAQAEALLDAATSAEHRVVFTAVEGWPPFAIPDAQVLGL